MLGFALAVAVLIDATIVQMLIGLRCCAYAGPGTNVQGIWRKFSGLVNTWVEAGHSVPPRNSHDMVTGQVLIRPTLKIVYSAYF
jgi:hypothetical protein